MQNDPRVSRTAVFLKVLAHPTRMRIIQLLSQHGELNATKIWNELNLDQSLVSHHLIKMSAYNMLVNRRQGKEVWYSLADSVLNEVVVHLTGER